MNKSTAMSRDSFRASQLLHAKGHYRSAISRAYYAIYAAIAAELSTVKGVRFGFKGNNPSHDSLPKLIRNLDTRRYSWKWKKDALRAFNTLWNARIRSDYGPSQIVDLELSRDCLLLAKTFIESIETQGVNS